LLRDLEFRNYLRLRQASEERMKRLARLEIYWTILDLQQHIPSELAVKRLQVFVSSARAVVTGLHVVNKRAPHDAAEVRFESGSEHVCAVSMRAVVRSWSRLSFAVCFNNETAEVRDQFVDLISLRFPPCNHGRSERIHRI